MTPRTLRLPASYYQQFDADYARDIPGEGYGGWRRAPIELSLDHTALVVMHAWDCGTLEQAPGSWRACEYVPRSYHICEHVLPPILQAVRASGLTLFHVVGHEGYYEHLPGYQRAHALSQPQPPRPERLAPDPALAALHAFRQNHAWPGEANTRARATEPAVNFPPQARPVGDEGIASNSDELFALCKHHHINHLIYTGFTIGGCLLTSPGGMLDMNRRGAMCSTIRQAVTAIENRETARTELSKELELWRVALLLGFVFEDHELIAALRAGSEKIS